MENGHLHDDKLFRAVHDRLSDYEAPSNGADWDAMSRALDSMPKNASFKMKFSLNSILVILGLVGVSALSFALVTNKGKNPDSNANTHAVVTQPKTNTVVPVNNTQPSSQNSFASSNEMGFTGNNSAVATENANTSATTAKTDVASTNTALNPDGTQKKRRNKNQLLFGDQIDPKKGFIYNTKENPNAIKQPVDPAPNVFYDYTEDGQLKTIRIKDSTTRAPRKLKSDSTATNFAPTGAPTEGGPTGFDMEQ
jgi:hypothetical protein